MYVCVLDELVILIDGVEEVICGSIIWFNVNVKFVIILEWLGNWYKNRMGIIE